MTLWERFLCRWIGHHRWDCNDSPRCTGNHRCVVCGHRPARVRRAVR